MNDASDEPASDHPGESVAARLERLGEGHLPGLIGLHIASVEAGQVEAYLEVRPELAAPNGYLHAATVVALADTACGYGCRSSLPEGASGFTTIELKCNFLSTARSGTIRAIARLVHGGRTTQLWDAEVVADESGRCLALFRCTQAVLYPRD